MSECGVASRRKSEELIAKGAVGQRCCCKDISWDSKIGTNGQKNKTVANKILCQAARFCHDDER